MNETMHAKIIFSEQRKFRAAHFCVYATFDALLVGDCKRDGSYLIFDARISTDDWAESHVDLNECLSVQMSNADESRNSIATMTTKFFVPSEKRLPALQLEMF